ncbi:MAG TPA: pantoate--beta-alanine ligase [Pseudogracilibacillus sp.]|nr:pantoate--beta-alanine ligase [Pseudogracilibacillus sp.]
MKIIDNLKEMNQEILKHKNKTIGYVPTMGFLHDGHLSLIKESVKENELTILSIYVNPLQFGPNEDYETYPRDAERDKQLAKENGVDIIFMPTNDVMYPKPLTFSLKVTQKTDVLCGKDRPGHFDGVVTVLLKLFNIIQPKTAYFGMKDAQQLAIVYSFVEQFNIPVTIKGLETIREDSGIAKSSRNVYLTEKEKNLAKAIPESLMYGADLIKSKAYNATEVLEKVKKKFLSTENENYEYLELLSFPDLEKITELNSTVIIAMAVKYKKARLIDNLIIDQNGNILTNFN